eukprot:757873-Hanusia_phi.AAC.4
MRCSEYEFERSSMITLGTTGNMQAGLSYHFACAIRTYSGIRGREVAVAACRHPSLSSRSEPQIAAFFFADLQGNALEDLHQDMVDMIESRLADSIRIVFGNKEENLPQEVDAGLDSIRSNCKEMYPQFSARLFTFLPLHTSAAFTGDISSPLTRADTRHARAHWRHEKWMGANLGGWFLLEPGPGLSWSWWLVVDLNDCPLASPLFEDCENALKERGGNVSATCEWSLCCLLDKLDKGCKAEVLRKHRENHFGQDTFKRIADHGLNAVRIPFGYWIITGPSNHDVYDGPALELLDEAVKMAGACKLQVICTTRAIEAVEV